MTMYSESLRAFLRPVLPFLDDEAVTEIMINGPEDVWIEKGGKLFKTEAKFTEEGLTGAARNMAQFVGRVLSDERPRLDARLPDGSRIHVVIPPIAKRGTTLSIRKFFKDKLTMDTLLKFGSVSPPMARLLEAAIEMKLNIMVAGGTGSGKTTLLNVISSLIPDDERILTIEDSSELQLNKTHLVAFESRPPDKYGKGAIDMGDLLGSALRMRPDRIVVGEVRGGEAFHLMQAMNTGHGGSLSTCHANTPTDTLRRLETLCLMSAVELPMVAVRAQVASAINLVVCCDRLHDGSRKVTAISQVLPLNEKGEYRTQDLFLYTPVTKDEQGHPLGYHAPTGIVPSFVAKARAYGFSDLTEAFFDPATYGLPPPPLFHMGEDYAIRWAPSLKHREKGQPDPDSYVAAWQQFERKLKVEARAKHGEPAPHAPPAPPPAPSAEPPRPTASARSPQPLSFTPTPRAAAAEPIRRTETSRPPARPKTAPGADDKTPPPTQNPFAQERVEAEEEPSIELADDLREEVERAKHTVARQRTRVGPAPTKR